MKYPEIRIEANLAGPMGNTHALLGLAKGALKLWGHPSECAPLQEAVLASHSHEEALACIRAVINLELIDEPAAVEHNPHPLAAELYKEMFKT